jgi:hypothetical protein
VALAGPTLSASPTPPARAASACPRGSPGRNRAFWLWILLLTKLCNWSIGLVWQMYGFPDGWICVSFIYLFLVCEIVRRLNLPVVGADPTVYIIIIIHIPVSWFIFAARSLFFLLHLRMAYRPMQFFRSMSMTKKRVF